MTIKDLGYSGKNTEITDDGFTIGRVTREYRERYIVSTGKRNMKAKLPEICVILPASRSDFPAVGDWVLINPYDQEWQLYIKSFHVKRCLNDRLWAKAAKSRSYPANIDVALIIQSIDNNFNLNRLERYLTICYASHIEPVLVISKIDLVSEEETASAIEHLGLREKKIKTIPLSNTSLNGLDQILIFCRKVKHIVLLDLRE